MILHATAMERAAAEEDTPHPDDAQQTADVVNPPTDLPTPSEPPPPSSSSNDVDPSVAHLDDHTSVTPLDVGLPPVPPSPTAASIADSHADQCLSCGKGGSLICCDSCSSSFHPRCAGLKVIPDGIWQCPICLGLHNHEFYRLLRRPYQQQQAQYIQQHFPHLAHIHEEQQDTGNFTEEEEEENENNKHCTFCKDSPPSLSSGAFFDPFFSFTGAHWNDEQNKYIYAHKICALWSPRVYLLPNGHMMNLVSEVNRARWLFCSECGKRGASIGCWLTDCHRTYHYPCAKEAKCEMFIQGFRMLCPEHTVTWRINKFFPVRSSSTSSGRGTAAAHSKTAKRSNKHKQQQLLTITDERIEYDSISSRPHATAVSVFSQYLSTITPPKRSSSLLTRNTDDPDIHLQKAERKRRRTLRARNQTLQQERDSRRKRRRRTLLHNAKDAGHGSDELALRELIDKRMKEEEQKLQAVEDDDGVDVWQNVGGLSSHTLALKECVLLPLLYPEMFAELEIQPPKGLLLHGPPGTGKTLLARTLARACSRLSSPVTFYHRKAADLLSKFHGESELQLRLLFSLARAHAPAIIYFDEIDGLAPVRSAKQNQVHSSIVTTLLALMDGLDDRGSVFLLASTNRLDSVDPALRRSGRFDREMLVNMPDRQARQQILHIHTRKWTQQQPDSNDAERHTAVLATLADRTVGYSGADLRALCSEAVLNAAYRCIPTLTTNMTRRRDVIVQCISTIAVQESDFQAAFNKLIPSSRRTDVSPFHSVPTSIHCLLASCLATAMEVLGLSNEATHHLPLAAPSTYLPSRVLIEGGSDAGHSQVCSLLLQSRALENCCVWDLSLPSLSADSQLSPQELLARRFHMAEGQRLNVFYLPQLEVWWTQASPALRATLLSCLQDLLASEQCRNIVLATCHQLFTSALSLQLPPFLQQFFADSTASLFPPTKYSKETFFVQLLHQAALQYCARQQHNVNNGNVSILLFDSWWSSLSPSAVSCLPLRDCLPQLYASSTGMSVLALERVCLEFHRSMAEFVADEQSMGISEPAQLLQSIASILNQVIITMQRLSKDENHDNRSSVA